MTASKVKHRLESYGALYKLYKENGRMTRGCTNIKSVGGNNEEDY